MTNKLTTIGSHSVAAKNSPTASLLGRGLNNLKSKADVIGVNDLEVTYREARDAYNLITDYGITSHFDPGRIPSKNERVDELAQKLQPLYELINQLKDHFILFQQLADQSFGKAYFPLAKMYSGGQGIDENAEKSHFYFKKAFEWSTNNSELLNIETWTDLGYIYTNGKGVEPKHDEAFTCYSRAAEQDYPSAQYALGNSFYLGHGIEKDYKQALYWYQKSADQGFRCAQSQIGEIYVTRGNDGLAFFWHLKAADQESAWSQYRIGNIYRDGRGVEQNDELALFWYQKAANQGNDWSQEQLGDMYRDGSGVEQNDVLAFFWYQKAADKGNYFFSWGDAQNQLGDMYRDGRGVEQNDELAFFWYQRAADQDHEYAQSQLGDFYRDGRGVAQNDELAFFWYQRAADQGDH